MYFQQGDHDNLARKKIQYFLADLRERYGLNTTNLDKEFMETLARQKWRINGGNIGIGRASTQRSKKAFHSQSLTY